MLSLLFVNFKLSNNSWPFCKHLILFIFLIDDATTVKNSMIMTTTKGIFKNSCEKIYNKTKIYVFIYKLPQQAHLVNMEGNSSMISALFTILKS